MPVPVVCRALPQLPTDSGDLALVLTTADTSIHHGFLSYTVANTSGSVLPIPVKLLSDLQTSAADKTEEQTKLSLSLMRERDVLMLQSLSAEDKKALFAPKTSQYHRNTKKANRRAARFHTHLYFSQTPLSLTQLKHVP